MGQKVHPLGYRRSNFAFSRIQRAQEKKQNYTNNEAEVSSVVFPSNLLAKSIKETIPWLAFGVQKSDAFGIERSPFEYGPRPGKGPNSYSKKLHEDFFIESIVEEFFKKSGYIVSSISIWRSSKELQLFVEIFAPSTLKKNFSGYGIETVSQVVDQGTTRSLIPSEPKVARVSEGKDFQSFDNGTALDLELDIFTKFLESFVMPTGNKEGASADHRKYLRHTTDSNLQIKWNITFLNKYLPSFGKKDMDAKGITRSLTKSLKSFNKEFFFTDGIAILALTAIRPNAKLLSNFMALVLEDLPKGQTFIDFIGQGLGVIFDEVNKAHSTFTPLARAIENDTVGTFGQGTRKKPISKGLTERNVDSFVFGDSPLKGILIKVKGRINGSDRSRISSYRYGSIPLHTIKAAIDYGFSTTKSSYGVSGIKVWFFCA